MNVLVVGNPEFLGKVKKSIKGNESVHSVLFLKTLVEAKNIVREKRISVIVLDSKLITGNRQFIKDVKQTLCVKIIVVSEDLILDFSESYFDCCLTEFGDTLSNAVSYYGECIDFIVLKDMKSLHKFHSIILQVKESVLASDGNLQMSAKSCMSIYCFNLNNVLALELDDNATSSTRDIFKTIVSMFKEGKRI